MKPKTSILLALHVAPDHTAGNDDIRRSMGRPDMPQCTVTWHLNELSDAGAVESDKMGRYNRWTLTTYGRELAEIASRNADRQRRWCLWRPLERGSERLETAGWRRRKVGSGKRAVRRHRASRRGLAVNRGWICRHSGDRMSCHTKPMITTDKSVGKKKTVR